MDLSLLTREELIQLVEAEREIERREEAERLEESLANFVEAAWPNFDAAAFENNWHIQAVCEHLEAVSQGQLPRLLINVPPRTGKTNVVSVCWSAWTWAQRRKSALMGPQTSFFYTSYAEQLSLEHSLKTRRLIESRWFKRYWGSRFSLTSDRNRVGHFENDKMGYRMASSVDAKSTGFGADILVADDPHLVKEAESDQVRGGVIKWWTETMPSRMNDRRTGAMVVVMQRVHDEDLSGFIISKELGYTHLMLPMEFDTKRVCRTSIGFRDSRIQENELLWPIKFPATEVEKIKREVGPYAFAGQYQQSPEPRGGGIIKRDWWQMWDGDEAKAYGLKYNVGKDGELNALAYPQFSYILASLDTAFTEKEENDASALTLWGVWSSRTGPKVMLMFAWEKRLELHELVEETFKTCSRFKVDTLLIESKASGMSVAQELRRRYALGRTWSIQTVDPSKEGDKVARCYSVQGTFAEKLVYAPDRDWADMVVNNFAVFPKGAHDDLVDSGVHALRHLRKIGLITRRDELMEIEKDARSYQKVRTPPPLYPV